MSDTANESADSIKVRRKYAVPRSKVVEAFRSRAALEKWFAPDARIEVSFTEFEFRVGGNFRIQYGMPNGEKPAVGGSYIVIDLPDELAFTWEWAAPDPHAGVRTTVHLKFIEDGGSTEIILTHCRLVTNDLRDRHKTAWEKTFALLETHFGLAGS